MESYEGPYKLPFGWSSDWIGNGKSFVSETDIKGFVNRYFSEDECNHEASLIMIFAKCKFCEDVQEIYLDEENSIFIFNHKFIEEIMDIHLILKYFFRYEFYIYNMDKTYTRLFPSRQCLRCGVTWSHEIELFWNEAEDLFSSKGVIFDSPLEKLFWCYWRKQCAYIPLIPQYQVGKYRIDFVHLATKTAIEIDGRRYHSTQEQRIYDQIRQVELERQGWHFIRLNYSDIVHNIYNSIVKILGALHHFK